ncbi:hypothetical protein QQP08_013263 [Theobroma cacao]|nr:hypothetical protein QQP08_013263 [Theobroma cacao]
MSCSAGPTSLMWQLISITSGQCMIIVRERPLHLFSLENPTALSVVAVVGSSGATSFACGCRFTSQFSWLFLNSLSLFLSFIKTSFAATVFLFASIFQGRERWFAFNRAMLAGTFSLLS